MRLPSIYLTTVILLLAPSTSSADEATEIAGLITSKDLKSISSEISGTSAMRNLDTISLYHRTRASNQFLQAASHIESKLREYGLSNVEHRKYPADGKTMYGTQKSRPAWNVNMAELWELDQAGNRIRRLGHWESTPLTVAQDSDSADIKAELIYIEGGSQRSDYQDKDVKGKIILTELQPGAVSDLAVKELGAAGIISYAPNQKSAWWKEDDELIRWGHLSSFRDYHTFGFMVSLREANQLRQRLDKGETIRMHAMLDAQRTVGEYSLITAIIPGTSRKEQEIVFTCHLDHPRPGANDNASGCVAILESARTLNRLIQSGRLPRPARTMRFIFPAEIEGSLIYLNSHLEEAKRFKAIIHMDMVGGDADITKAIFRVSRGPLSSVGLAGDVAWEVTRFVNQHSLDFASGKQTNFPLIAKNGGKEALLAQFEWLDIGSDHDVFAEGSWGIPVVYLHDWPDIYIHTTKDMAANIDPTKLKRSAFIGSTTAYILATLDNSTGHQIQALVDRNFAVFELEKSFEKNTGIENAMRDVQGRMLASVCTFTDSSCSDDLKQHIPRETYRRNPDIKGTMNAFGYSYLNDHMNSSLRESLRIFQHPESRMLAYEALNLVNGKRSFDDIINLLEVQFTHVDPEAIKAYFEALKTIDVILP